MADIVTLLVLGVIVALAAGWALLVRRRPRKPTTAGFTRMEDGSVTTVWHCVGPETLHIG